MFRVLTKALIFREDKILVLKRSLDSSFGGGLWDIPGGKLEFGESPEECLKREVLEETSINISISQIFSINSGISKEKNKQYITLLYLAKYVSGDVKLNIESSEFKWIKNEDIKKYNSIYYLEDAIKKLKNI